MSRKQLNDAELDALVVRSLSRLPALGPSRAFPSKVMNRVQLPSPRAVQVWRRTRAWLAQPRRAVVIAGTYAVAAAIGLIIAVPWLLQHSPALSLAYDWTVAAGGALLRDAMLGIANWTVSSGIAGLFKSVPRSGPSMWVLAFGATAAYAGCAIGLHYLLRAPRTKHASVEA